AGFEPLEVIEHATWNGARLIGMDDRLGKVREGFIGDLLVVNGNPLENLKLLNPYGTDVMLVNGRPASSYTALALGDRVQNVPGARRAGVLRSRGARRVVADRARGRHAEIARSLRDRVAGDRVSRRHPRPAWRRAPRHRRAVPRIAGLLRRRRVLAAARRRSD